MGVPPGLDAGGELVLGREQREALPSRECASRAVAVPGGGVLELDVVSLQHGGVLRIA